MQVQSRYFGSADSSSFAGTGVRAGVRADPRGCAEVNTTRTWRHSAVTNEESRVKSAGNCTMYGISGAQARAAGAGWSAGWGTGWAKTLC